MNLESAHGLPFVVWLVGTDFSRPSFLFYSFLFFGFLFFSRAPGLASCRERASLQSVSRRRQQHVFEGASPPYTASEITFQRIA